MKMTSSRAPRPTPPIRARRPIDRDLLQGTFVAVVMLCLAMGVCVAIVIGIKGLR
jgi:hypothetical protein